MVEEMRLLVPETYRDRGPNVDLSDFAEAAWISTREGSAGTLALERACARAGFAPRIRYRTNDYDVVRSFVRAGLGVAAVPLLAHVGRSDLRVVNAAGLTVRRHVEALTVTERTSPATEGMVGALKAASNAINSPQT
jgi:DNA-binding transcriptional LysR family regulator